MTRPPAYVLLCCAATKGYSAARFASPRDRVWELAAATPYNPVGALPRSASTGLEGRFAIAGEYEGCPRCGANSCAQCGRCGQLSCWRSESRAFTCGSCGHSDDVQGHITTLRRVD